MSQLIVNGAGTAKDHSLPAILAGIVLTACVFAGASVLSFERPVILVPTVHTDPGSLSDPIANPTEFLRQKVDRPSVQEGPWLDHSVVDRKGILAEPDPSSPMSPAYYHV